MSLLKNLLLIVLSILIIGEGFSRILLSFVIRYDVEMTRYGTLLKKKYPNSDFLFSHHPNNELKLMGVDVKTNSFGLRDKEYSLEKDDSYRVAVLGDSLTFGWGVEKQNTFEHLLERELSKARKIELINFGHGNYNTHQEVNYFLQRGKVFKPDHIVLFYFINDAELPQVDGDISFLAHSRFFTLIWSSLRKIFPSVSNSGYISFEDYYQAKYKDDFKGWALAKTALGNLNSYCLKNNIKFNVVLLPELHKSNPYPFKNEHNKVIEFVNSLKRNHLDLAEVFKEEKNLKSLWVSPDDSHPNKSAHGKIAKATLPFLLKEIQGVSNE